MNATARACAALIIAGAAARVYAQEPFATPKSDSAVLKDGGLAIPSGYLTIKDETTALTTQSILSFLGAGVTCANNAGNFATECTIPGGAGYATVMEEGGALTQRATVNFIGGLITCADNGGSTRTDCTVASAYTTVDDEGTPLTQRAVIDFAGSGVACVDSGGVKTLCTITAGGTTPTGTGFRHVIAGVEDAAAKLVDTADINAAQVSYAKIQNVASLRLLGNGTGGAAAPSELSLAAELAFPTTTSLGIATNGVTNAKAAQMAANTIKGNNTAATANAADLTLTQLSTLLQTCSIAPTNCYSFLDDFSSYSSSITSPGNDVGNWLVTNSGAAAGVSRSAAVTGHPGVDTFTTGTTTTGVSSMVKDPGRGFFLNGAELIDVLVRVPTLSNGTDRFEVQIGWTGGGNAASEEATDGLFFTYVDNANSGNWFFHAIKATAGVGSLDTTVAVVGGTWYHLRLIANSASSYQVIVNGTNAGNFTTAADIPVLGLTPHVKIWKSLGTTAGTLDVDYAQVVQTGLAR